jgi:hypothetical protein
VIATRGSFATATARAFAALAALAAALGCSTTRAVRPLGRGNAAFGISAGGPLVQALGADLATPIVTVGEVYGARDDLDVFVNADLTAAVYGNLHVEPGAAYHFLVRDGGPVPTLTAAGSAHFLTDFDVARIYPQLTVTAAWLLHRRHVLYLGADGALGFSGQTRALVGPLVGVELRSGRVGVQLEAKWIAPYYDVAPTAPSWISPASHGYLTLLVGLSYHTEEAP